MLYIYICIPENRELCLGRRGNVGGLIGESNEESTWQKSMTYLNKSVMQLSLCTMNLY